LKLSKAYEPQAYEADIYALWEKNGYFTPKKASHKDSYAMVLPPPNANANLHTGHALDFMLKDVMARYQRAKGKQVLMLPGADHAGFETWVVFEKKLNAEGKSRFDFSRENLYQMVWDFVALNRGNMENQVRRLGVSCDWTRNTYTLDEPIVRTAYSTFEKMWSEGLIYRGERLVNFCTYHGTSFADIEVIYKEKLGKLYYISYPINGEDRSLSVATTRPETMLGDTAVAVNPKDARYKDLVGKTIHLPLTNRDIPIIADDMVDTEFGTGAVKITPAHDPNDFEVGERHDLPRITVISHEGKMVHHTTHSYGDLSVEDARDAIVNDLKEQGYLEKTEDYTHSVGHCYKCETVIQPLIREQWFINMQPLAKQAIQALKKGDIVFHPQSKRDELIQYLKGLRDWNISRQIAWGIPIPAFQNVDNPDDWIFDTRVEQETISINNKTYRRDPDVFDTWFSSSQWPYATLGYPDSPDTQQFYPTMMMETGVDLLRQWVSRMINMGLYVTNQVPFKEVYFHGMVLDDKGAKMSKSKGNVINPMDIIDEYGSDALRVGLLTGLSAGNGQPFGTPKVVGGRNFANKLWNIARYIETTLGDDFKVERNLKPSSSADHWIIKQLQSSIESIDKALGEYRFSDALDTLYHFIWDDLADWYIEASKITPNHQLLAYVLDSSLRLAHPFAPFVTETIWQTLSWTGETLLAEQKWPEIVKFDQGKAKEFNELQTIVSEIRYITSVLEIKKPGLYYKKSDFLKRNGELIVHLARLSNCLEVRDGKGMRLTQTSIDCWLDVDIETAKRYSKKLEVNQLEYQQIIEKLKGRLSNESYVNNAPKEVVEQTKTQLKEQQMLLEKVENELKTFIVR
jgi:valyl-tRNA synthetase